MRPGRRERRAPRPPESRNRPLLGEAGGAEHLAAEDLRLAQGDARAVRGDDDDHRAAAPVDDRGGEARIRDPAMLLDEALLGKPAPEQAGVVAGGLRRRAGASGRYSPAPARVPSRAAPTDVRARRRAGGRARGRGRAAVVTRVCAPGRTQGRRPCPRGRARDTSTRSFRAVGIRRPRRRARGG